MASGQASAIMPPVLPKLDSTLGAAFIGNVIIAVLYGISCVQIYTYHQRSSRDSRTMQALIFILWVLDTLQLIFWAQALYYFSVTNFFNPSAIQVSPWSLVIDYATGLLSDTLVTGIYTYRLWRLGKRFITVQIFIQVISALVSCATGSLFLGLSWGKSQVEANLRYRWCMLADFGAKGVGDICITLSLWIALRRMRTDVRRTKSLIRTIAIYSMGTCALTSVSVIGTIVALLVVPKTYIFTVFSVMLPKLVFNSLLAFLNSREHFAPSENEPLSIHLSRIPGSQEVRSMSPIQIEVSKSTYVDKSDITLSGTEV